MEDFPRLVLLIIGAVLTYPMFMQGVNSRTSDTKISPSDEVSTLRKTLFALGEQSVDVTVGTQTELYQEYSLQDDCSRPRECGEVRCCGKTRSGIYKVFPFGVGKGCYVFCDFQTDDNAWTVIQRRQDGSVDFDRNWDEYEKGFGQLDGEFWLGLSTIHEMLSQFRFELLITMRNFSGGEAWAKYNWIYVSGPREKYRLQIGSYSGTAGVNGPPDPKIPPSDEISTLRRKLFALGQQSADSSTRTPTELYHDYGLQDNCYRPRECEDVRCCGKTRSGIYKIYPFGVGKGRHVFCDLQTDDNAWTVIQRRQDGSVDFNRDWDEYEKGFGQLDGEFWLGLSTIHELLSQFRFELLITMRNFSGGEAWAKYNWVYVSGPREKYRLQIGSYSGTAGDSLEDRHNGRMFTTRDSDNDESDTVNCAVQWKGAGWFGRCHYAHLNGLYCGVTAKDSDNASCVSWYHWHSGYKPLQYVDVKVRPVNSQPVCPSNNS